MDKLTILNRALLATGNSRINVLNDGSDEWQVADEAFDRAVSDLASRHKWPFALRTASLVEMGENPSQRFDYAFSLPAAALHVKAVYVAGTPNYDYEVIGRALCLDHADGVVVEYVAAPDDADWHPQAVEILTIMVEAGCLRGLNEDFAEARAADQRAEERLMEARPHIDQQNPARNAYVSRIAEARRVRRG